MKATVFKFFVFLFVLGFFAFASPASLIAQNSITGLVFDHNRRPVANIDVELLDDLERLIRSRKTRGSGFYSFQRLNRGIYYLKVRVGGTNFRATKVRIDLGDLNSIGGVDVKQVDIYLELDDRKSGRIPATNAVIFAQSIPPEAEQFYKRSLILIDKKKLAQETQNLIKAIEVFPDYYNALFRIGKLYLDQSKFAEAETFLLRAADVNPKSFTAFFGLGVAQHNLKKRRAAIRNLRKANEIDANSINSHLLLGIVQRDAKLIKDSKKSLLEAKRLSENRIPDVHWNLALLYYYDLKKYSDAADELELYISALQKDKKKGDDRKISEVKRLIETFGAKASDKT